MKLTADLAFVLNGLAPSVFGQAPLAEQATEPVASTSASERLEVVGGPLNPTAVRFTPPPPPKPAPQVVAEASSVIRKATHSITLVRGEPSTLPDIPPPPERVEQTNAVSFPPQRPNFLLGLSVIVYSGLDRDLSYLRWRDPETEEQLEAWCGWNWALVAPMQRISNDRVVYNLFFSPWIIDTTKPQVFGRRLSIPDHPPVAADEFVITVGNAGSPAGKDFLEAVQRYCVANRPELEEMRAARDQYQADAEAWRKANPKIPRDHTMILRPHRGSRYLKGRSPASENGESTTGEAVQ
jgi:hypothetical protein